MPRAKAISKRSSRDPARTRERILAAALIEFSIQGFAGARVDAVALRAAVNKRMLYHYFGNKRKLFREVLRRKMADRTRWLDSAPTDPAQIFPYWFERAWQDLDWIRLLAWEALQLGDVKIIDEKKRREACERTLAVIRDGQARGLVSREFEADQILLSMVALTTYPLAFPQITKLVTGRSVNTEEFHQRRAEFLRRFVVAFRPQPDRPAPPASDSSEISDEKK
jgi:AcrR family transcriptional regulator